MIYTCDNCSELCDDYYLDSTNRPKVIRWSGKKDKCCHFVCSKYCLVMLKNKCALCSCGCEDCVMSAFSPNCDRHKQGPKKEKYFSPFSGKWV